ncbi:hypothetical protein ACFV7Q_23710 [Streptomyces sp. NPDC059851]|uniref:hypothetical protein n=1 Tax=Streptomyces sp. NPDC059851 TaxID=3346971 RepID=UPI003661202B
MSTTEMGGESTGEDPGREPAGPAGEPAPRRRRPGGRQLVATLAIEMAGAAVSAWAPEWSEVAQALTAAARVAVRLRRGRGGWPRG